jgi:protein-S-isoprenylcysteine O-methyltransferase Ste14
MLQGDTIKQPIVSPCNISLEKLDSIELSCRCTSSQPLVYLESTYERSEAAYDVEELAAADVVDGAILKIGKRRYPMQRLSFFFYGVINHLLFFVAFMYLAGFVGNVFVPKSIDSTPANTFGALGVDLLLILLFALPHSIMARPWFKRVWTQWVHPVIERSTYVLIANICIGLLMWQWQGFDIVVWNVQHPATRGLLWVLFAAGWLMVFAASLMINHFDLFGTRQVWLHLRGLPYTALPFRTPLLYNRIRHPLYFGWTMAFWATPSMTVGHLLFAGTLTMYMAIAARVEESDLVNHFGEKYRAYQRRVPMFLPRFGDGNKTATELPATIPTIER